MDQPDENGTGVAKQFDNLEELVDHYKEFGMVDTATSLIRPDTPGQIFLFSLWYVRAKLCTGPSYVGLSISDLFFISVSVFLKFAYIGGILETRLNSEKYQNFHFQAEIVFE